MVHVGEKSYYDQVQELCAKYDRVLFELITTPDMYILDSNEHYGKTLKENVYALKSDKLAREYNLVSQLDMNLMRPGWYIADLPKTVKNEHLATLAVALTIFFDISRI